MPRAPMPGIRRYARAVRHPNLQSWHGWYDPRSWAVAVGLARTVRPSPHDARRAIRLAHRGRTGGRFLATLPRSGSNLVVAILNSAHAIDRGEDGDYDFVPGFARSGDPGWAPHGQRLVWPAPAASLLHAVVRHPSELPERPALSSHFPLGTVAVPADRGGRPVVLVRHPQAALRSMVRKRGLVTAADGPAAELVARNHVRWFHSWAAAIDLRPPGEVLLLRYEDLVGDPTGAVTAVDAHWNLGWSPSTIAAAVALCSRERMEEKAGHDPANVRVTVGEQAPIDGEVLRRLDRVLATELRRTLGYEIAGAAEHGRPTSGSAGYA